MKNISIERMVPGAFIAAAVVLVLLGGMAWRSAVKADEASSQVMRTHQILTTVEQIMFNLTRAETAQRDYYIYGENYYMQRRDKSLLDVANSVGEAERLIIVPVQQEHLRQLKMLISQRMEYFLMDHNGHGKRIATEREFNVKAHHTNGQLVVVGFGSRPPILDQIHDAIGRIVEKENGSLLEREAEHAFQRKIEHMSFVMLSVYFPLLLFFLFLRIRRTMRLIRDEELLLKNANLKLEKASRMKSEFLAHMSHEIRTPINSIMGFSELLKDGRLGKLTKAQTGYLNDIYDSGQHLLSLINNILDLSRIEAGKMALDLEPVEISALLDNSIFIIREKIATQHVRLHLDVQPGLGEIHVDPIKVRQILYNLLSNAVKFIPDNGQLKLRARRVPRSEVGQVSGNWPSRTFQLAEREFTEFLEISVVDCGIGIPREGLTRLFQPYSQIASGAAHKFEGTGLGLMLVKHMAELHGGTVAVESAEGKGSRFIVWLPLRTNVVAAIMPEELISRQSAPEVRMKTRKISARALLEQARQLAQQRTFVNI
jgi:signal transduction histidine kinase